MILCLSDRMGIEASIPVHRADPRRSHSIPISPVPETARPYRMGPKRHCYAKEQRSSSSRSVTRLPGTGFFSRFSNRQAAAPVCVCVLDGWKACWRAGFYGSIDLDPKALPSIRSIEIAGKALGSFGRIDPGPRSIRGKANRTEEGAIHAIRACVASACSVGRGPGACATPPRVGSSIQEGVGESWLGWLVD